MDCRMYYSAERNGTFSVTFQNKRALTVNEIKELFSKYGTVTYVNCTGDLKGHRFVKYASEEDAVRCVRGFQNHEFIKLLPKKHKDDQSNGNSKQTYNNTKNVDFAERKKNVPTCFKNKENQNIFKDDSKSVSSGTSASSNSIANYSRVPGTASLRNSLSRLADIKQKRGIISDTFKVRLPKHLDNDKVTSPSNDDFEADHTSVRSQSTAHSLEQDRIKSGKPTVAQDVVVANIGPNFGLFYILHLLEKYEPIAASLIQTIPNTNIRYCHVYFETPELALAVEQEFDNYNLHETNSNCKTNKLIVLRTDMLMKETALR